MLDWLKEVEMATRLKRPSRASSPKARNAPTTSPVAAATRTRRGEGGNASTLDVAKAVADYAR